MRNLLAVVLVALAAALWYTPQPTEAHHTGVPCGNTGASLCLPYASNSYAVNLIKTTGELTYCYDSRAANYPNFKRDVERVHAHETSVTGVGWREIPGVYQTDTAARAAGCQVWNSMPDTHGCPTCGAWVHYLNAPVIVEYNYIHGYVTFDTTIGHEEGHIFGLHEGYLDDTFQSHRNTRGTWYRRADGSKPGTATDSPTVMDFGTGEWRWSAADVKFICQNIDGKGERLAACGYQAPPPPPPCVPTVGTPCWNGEAWLFHDGGAFIPNGGCGIWLDAQRRHTWGDCDYSWGARWHGILRVWAGTGLFFHPDSNTWYEGTIVQK